MILIIDNYDSFTYNFDQQIQSLGKATKVVQHDKVTTAEIAKINPSKIIISPGPKRPEDSGISIEVIKKFYATTPILGVCLGHECIGQIFGSNVVQAKEIRHGKVSYVYHTEDNLLKGLKNPFKAARYHSLVIDKVPTGFSLTAWTRNDEIMAIHHNKYPVFGVQFHPESFLTPEGEKLMQNFLYEF